MAPDYGYSRLPTTRSRLWLFGEFYVAKLPQNFPRKSGGVLLAVLLASGAFPPQCYGACMPPNQLNSLLANAPLKGLALQHNSWHSNYTSLSSGHTICYTKLRVCVEVVPKRDAAKPITRLFCTLHMFRRTLFNLYFRRLTK